MKKNLLILLIIFSTLELYSQIDKGNVIVSVDGNYNKTINTNGVEADNNTIKGQYLSVGASIGYFLMDNFVIGIGLDYDWNKENRLYEMTLIYKYFQEEEMNIKFRTFIPNLYFGYYYLITNKLYFNTNIKFSYGKIKNEINSIYSGFDIITDTGSNYVRIPPNQYTEKDFFSTKISPEMIYFISSKFSICLNLGGLGYSIIDWNNNNSSWTIDFNPIYWRLGIKMKI